MRSLDEIVDELRGNANHREMGHRGLLVPYGAYWEHLAADIKVEADRLRECRRIVTQLLDDWDDDSDRSYNILRLKECLFDEKYKENDDDAYRGTRKSG